MTERDVINDLCRLVAEQTARIERLEARLAPDVTGAARPLEVDVPVSRRHLLRLGGAAAAGTAATLLASRPAAAAPSADGDVKLGGSFADNNAGSSMTQVQASISADSNGTGRPALYGYNTGSGQGVLGQSAGVQGIGVWGLGAGTDGIGVRAQGTLPLELVSADGTRRTRFTVVDNGPPHVILDGGFSTAKLAVVGATNDVTKPTMLFGAVRVDLSTSESNVAVLGDASSPAGPTIGVVGSGTSGTVNGVVLPGYGVQGIAEDGIGVYAEGGRAQLRLRPGDTLDIPAGPHSAGEIYMTAAGHIHICKIAGTPGTWTRIGFNPLRPFRLVDTRDNNSPLGPGERRAFTVAPTGAAPNNVPGGGVITAVMLNVTAAPAPGHAASYFTVLPHSNDVSIPPGGDAPYSNVNWGAGQLQANLATVPMPAFSTQFDVFNRHGNVHLIIDVLGYYA